MREEIDCFDVLLSAIDGLIEIRSTQIKNKRLFGGYGDVSNKDKADMLSQTILVKSALIDLIDERIHLATQ